MEDAETANNAVQCIIIEKSNAESLWSANNRRLLCRNNPFSSWCERLPTEMEILNKLICLESEKSEYNTRNSLK